MRRMVCTVALLALAALDAGAVELTHVRHEPAAFDPAKGEVVGVHFHLSGPAEVAMNVYDGRDLRVQRIESASTLPAGDHRLVWDGRDSRGDVVPPEAYVYALEAQGDEGQRALHDLTDATGGDAIVAQEIRYDAEAERVRYFLPHAARIAIRVGLGDGGPFLGSILQWVPRLAGDQSELWDGRDVSGVLDLSEHPGRTLGVGGFTLPDNAILVLPTPQTVELIALPDDAPKRTSTRSPPRRVADHSQQPIETRGDFRLRLSLPDDLPRGEDGHPIVRGPVPVRVDVAEKDRERAWSRRFETSFFVDGRFVHENETGFLPMTWEWDPSGVSQGTHFVTVNLRGYEGNFGAATTRIRVAGDPPATSSEGEPQQ